MKDCEHNCQCGDGCPSSDCLGACDYGQTPNIIDGKRWGFSCCIGLTHPDCPMYKEKTNKEKILEIKNLFVTGQVETPKAIEKIVEVEQITTEKTFDEAKMSVARILEAVFWAMSGESGLVLKYNKGES